MLVQICGAGVGAGVGIPLGDRLGRQGYGRDPLEEM